MTESVLKKVHIFPSVESYKQNSQNVGEDDIALVPSESSQLKTFFTNIIFDGNVKTINHNLGSNKISVNGINSSGENIWIEYTIINDNSISIDTGNIGQNINIFIIA